MSFAEGFDIGYLKVFANRREEVFLSVTPNFRLGPGIQRDGITSPRMTDPHTVPFVMGRDEDALSVRDYPATTNAFVQRAGTRTLFEHVYEFKKKYGEDYLIIGVQSCGDLTMNPWHVAFVWEDGLPVLYRLGTHGDPQSIQEPWHERTYRCLVKWKQGVKDCPYAFLDLKFVQIGNRFEAREVPPDHGSAQLAGYITEDIEFALSGKIIINRGQDVSLASAIDRFQDVRHVFNVPEVPVRDLQGQPKGKINFGEHVLFHSLNSRRAALSSPIVIDLRIPNRDLVVHFEDLEKELEERYHYTKSSESPTRRGEYRRYSENSVELFYRHNVYPFGVVGGSPGEIVCLASGGLSGRVGNTLEGIIRIMFDFFGCDDALVLDEGYDTFHIVNPNPKKKQDDPDDYQYDNDEILRQVAAFTLWRTDLDRQECEETETKMEMVDRYKLGTNLWEWPLNSKVIKILKEYCDDLQESIEPQPSSTLDVMAVEPRRSQMRSVLIFAVRRDAIRETKK
ncbi:hypothetical protein [Desulfospira joergensenii]|uniref:hypothetical protein n=1 Tax=Desulfospira joergensenii TaxID=53329 RepID=UPI0003B3AA91|nr:hypothetical protein [Desulfospira joergensenii]